MSLKSEWGGSAVDKNGWYCFLVNPELQRIAALLEQLVAAHQKSFWDYASLGAVILTLLAVGYYTYETYQLRREAQTQTRLSSMPVVVFGAAITEKIGHFRGTEQTEITPYLSLRNIGVAPAVNVRIHFDEWPDEYVKFIHSRAIGAGQDEWVTIIRRTAEGGSDAIFHPMRFALAFNGATTSGWVSYNDVGGTRYKANFTVDFRTHKERYPLFEFEGIERSSINLDCEAVIRGDV